MPDFNVRGDAVNVEQIMEQIRARIREKRGVDYTEEQIRELAAVKLEKFLDPRSIRSDLLEQFRNSQPPPPVMPLYPFEDTTLFDSHRGIIRFFRRLFRPLLKLFFNSNALAQSLHQQTIINQQVLDRLEALRQRGDLYYELLHNLVLELTRATIEVKNISMRVESIASRLEFNERRARALESVVVYKATEAGRDARPAAPAPTAAAPPRGGFTPREGSRQTPPQPPAPRTPPPAPLPSTPPSAVGSTMPVAAGNETSPGEAPMTAEGPGQRSRRRRRRRGRRGGASAVSIMNAGAVPGGEPSASSDARANETREGEPAKNAALSGHAAEPAPPEEPREAEPLRLPSPAEPSASEPPVRSGDHDVDDL